MELCMHLRRFGALVHLVLWKIGALTELCMHLGLVHWCIESLVHLGLVHW